MTVILAPEVTSSALLAIFDKHGAKPASGIWVLPADYDLEELMQDLAAAGDQEFLLAEIDTHTTLNAHALHIEVGEDGSVDVSFNDRSES